MKVQVSGAPLLVEGRNAIRIEDEMARHARTAKTLTPIGEGSVLPIAEGLRSMSVRG